MQEATVQSLRKMGLKVGVSHLRNYNIVFPKMPKGNVNHAKPQDVIQAAKNMEDAIHELMNQKPALEVSPRGGMTTVTVTGLNGATVTGYTECSNKDNFNKRLGTKIALARALKSAQDNEINLF